MYSIIIVTIGRYIHKYIGYYMILHRDGEAECKAVLWIPRDATRVIELCVYNVEPRVQVCRQQAAKILREWRALCREDKRVRT